MKALALSLTLLLALQVGASPVLTPQPDGGECFNKEAFDVTNKEFVRLQQQEIELKAENYVYKNKTEELSSVAKINVPILGVTIGIGLGIGFGLGYLIGHKK